jgi:hypothetical protein
VQNRHTEVKKKKKWKEWEGGGKKRRGKLKLTFRVSCGCFLKGGFEKRSLWPFSRKNLRT